MGTISAVVLAASAPVASADGVGIFGPYGVSVQNTVYYSGYPQDSLVECKPVATPGHFSGPPPVMMLIHGGGWTGGTAAIGPGYTGYSGTWCSLWASWGWDTFSVDFRTLYAAPWPAQIVDVQAAIRWVRANANYLNVNTSLLGINGDSSGGQLAMIAGYSDQIIPGDLAGLHADMDWQPDLIISQFGPWTWGPYAPPGTPSPRPEDYAYKLLADQAAGLTNRNAPDTLFLEGNYDTLTYPCTEAEAAYWFLTSKGHPASYLGFNGGHEFTNMDPSTWIQVVGTLETQSIAFAYARAHYMGVIPGWEPGPNLPYETQLPGGCS